MQYGIAFTPLVPALVLWLALAAIIVIAALLLLGRARGAAVRVAALALILLALRNILSSLDVPELEPVPREHVLTKTFYLLRDFPGRFNSGQTWVETLPRDDDDEAASRPARGGDGVSPPGPGGASTASRVSNRTVPPCFM